MDFNPLNIPEVREFFQAQAEVERRHKEAEDAALQERAAERRTQYELRRAEECAEFQSALNAVREGNAANDKQREALKGKTYGEMTDKEFRLALNKDFGLHW